MKPEISSMSADSLYHALAENHDGHAQGIDFHSIIDTMAAQMRQMAVPAEEQASVLKQLWNDMVDDVVGKKAQASGA
jgi:hypothetical protein